MPTIAGMPSASATMAVWLPAPPISVTKPFTNFGLRLEVSLGVSVWARTQHFGVDLRELFAAFAEEVTEEAFFDVEDVGGRARACNRRRAIG